MDYIAVAEQLKASYRGHSSRYRHDDEIEVTTEPHQRLRRKLEQITVSFDRPIRVLDLGCGTGRYFYCLQNVDQLIGVDLSPEMLAAAQHPVLEDRITARDRQLVCANVFELSFAENSFDFIYSLGMFGFGCPVTADLCREFHRWLKPGGWLFFDTLDRAALARAVRLRRQVRRLIFPVLPDRIRHSLESRHQHPPMFDMTPRQLKRMLRATPFRRFSLASHAYQSPVWHSIKLECLAQKD